MKMPQIKHCFIAFSSSVCRLDGFVFIFQTKWKWKKKTETWLAKRCLWYTECRAAIANVVDSISLFIFVFDENFVCHLTESIYVFISSSNSNSFVVILIVLIT